MPRKAKKKIHPMPKLGWKDQILYWAGMLITGIGGLFCLFFPTYYRNTLAAGNPLVLSWDAGAGNLHSLWLYFWLFFACILILVLYRKRIPIFGHSDIRYGPPAYPRVYPLLMKNKPQHWQGEIAKKKAATRKWIIAGALLTSFLLCVALYPSSLANRYELLKDGTVVSFDSHNRQKARYAISDIETVCLDTERTRRTWHARITIRFSDDEHCDFSIKSFADNWTDALYIAQMLKENYGPTFYIEDTQNLWRVVLYNKDMTSEETELLYQLFEVEP